MADSNRPKYISFDIYGTLINWDTDTTTRRLLAGRLPEEQWPAFKKVFRGYRFDEVLGDYKPYEQILQDSLTGYASTLALGRPPVRAQSLLTTYVALVPTMTCRPR